MSLYERQENETIALEVEKAKTLNVYQKFDLNAYKEMLDKKKEEQSMIEAWKIVKKAEPALGLARPSSITIVRGW